MRKQCFGYKPLYSNGCSVLKGAVNCEKCSFYKTMQDYYKGLGLLTLSRQENKRRELTNNET